MFKWNNVESTTILYYSFQKKDFRKKIYTFERCSLLAFYKLTKVQESKFFRD